MINKVFNLNQCGGGTYVVRITGSIPELDICNGSNLRPDLSMYEKEKKKTQNAQNTKTSNHENFSEASETTEQVIGEVEKDGISADEGKTATWLATLLYHRSHAAWA